MGEAEVSMQEFEEMRISVSSLRKAFEEEAKKTVEFMRKKDANIRDLTKEVDTLKSNVKTLKKASDDTKKFFREALTAQVDKAKDELTKNFEAALDVGDRMIRSNVDEVINRKFEQGFGVIEKECRTLFNRISQEVDARAEGHEKECVSKIHHGLIRVEKDLNCRCKELILLKMNEIEFAWRAMCAKSVCWNIENFNERMMEMYALKDGSAIIASPVFNLALLPRMFVEVTIENVSRGEAHNEWFGGNQQVDLPGPEGLDNLVSLPTFTAKPTPLSGNLTVVVYFQKKVDVLKMRITAGPPENEVSKIVSHRDFVQKGVLDDESMPGSMALGRDSTIAKRASQMATSGVFKTSRAQSTAAPRAGGNVTASRTANDRNSTRNSKKGSIISQGDIVKSVFDTDEKRIRKFDPLDMCIDTTLNIQERKQEVVVLGMDEHEDDYVELRIPNFCMIQRVYDRRLDSIPLKIEILECGNQKHYRKHVHVPGLNYNQKELIKTYDQFIAPNFITTQLNGALNRVRNRSLRRATWDVKDIRELCRIVPSGQYIESKSFRLAGLDAVKLVFYPNGINDINMQCALFLVSCSSDDENPYLVRCVLSVNRVSKVFQGDIRATLGKRRFCKLNNCEEVRIGVEIVEMADQPLTIATNTKYDKLEEVFQLPPAGGQSSYVNNTMSSRPLTQSSGTNSSNTKSDSSNNPSSRPITTDAAGKSNILTGLKGLDAKILENDELGDLGIPDERNHPFKSAFS